MEPLAQGVLAGEPRAVSRAITLVENRSIQGQEIIRAIYRETGRARMIGLTGSPGVGKSTLASRLIAAFRSRELKVGIIAVDPTSPYTGGAILGDRIRMVDHYTDPGVFIRSMATRGKLGGVAPATADVADILDAAGFDVILIETVGVGQDEVDIVRIAETVVVILVPGLGDEIQAYKAGIMEIADVFAVNKADTPGTDRLMREVRALLSLAGQGPVPQVLPTVATTGEGTEALASHLLAVRSSRPAEAAQARRRELAEKRLTDILTEELLRRARGERFEALVSDVARRSVDPFTAAGEVLADVLGRPGR